MGRTGRAPFRGWFVTIVAVALVGAACGGSSANSSSELSLGLLVDLSGPFKSFGTDIQTAVNLAAEQINAKGGVQGDTIKIVVRDTGGDPQQAVVGLRELATQSNVDTVIGPVSSSEAEAVFAQAARLKVPILTGTANKEGITTLGKGWAFRDTATNTQLYSAAMPLYRQHFNVTKVALVFDEKQAFAAAAAMFAIPAIAEKVGIQINDTVPVQTGQTDFTSVVQRIKGLDIDGLFVVTAPIEGGLLARELVRQGVQLPVLGHPAQNSGAFRSTAGGSVHDWVLPAIANPQAAGSKAAAFNEAMAKRDKQPPTVPESANYYDIVYMIAQAADSNGIDLGADLAKVRSDLRAGLAGLKDFQGVVGAVSFQPNGDVDRQVFTLLLEGDATTVLT